MSSEGDPKGPERALDNEDDGPSTPVADLDSDNKAITLTLLPRIPLILRVILFHMLGISEQSKYLDLRTEVITRVMQSYMCAEPISISKAQQRLTVDLEIKGRVWISKYACPAPTDTGIQDAIASAIDGLWEPTADSTTFRPRMPKVVPVEAEWTGCRAGVANDARLPKISQQERYDEMMKGVTSPTTFLYFHGGAFWLMDPATHRMTTKQLAKRSGGRCYSVRYRLAPQNPFPSALMDALISYLTLLYPPPGAFHETVPAEHIVFAGDSSGGNLALSLLQTLLQLQRQGTPVFWQGEARTVPLPAGVAVNSPWMDITHSSPSCETNAAFDYLPSLKTQLSFEQRRPRCAAWPASPPRHMIYAEDDMVIHPLVSPLLAKSWKGAPPLWICTGKELLEDEDKFTAARFYEDGAPVVFEEYEGMPHCFALLFAQIPEGKRCLEGWAGFGKRVVEGRREDNESRFTMIKAITLREVEVEFEGLKPYSMEEIRGKIARRMELGWVPAEGLAKL